MANSNFILWGASGHARVLADVLALRGDHVVALFDNNSSVQSPWPDVPIYHGAQSFVEWTERNRDQRYFAAIAIGGSRGLTRCEIAAQLQAAGLTFPALLHPSSVVARSAQLSPGSQVLAGAVVGVDAQIGAHTILNTGSQVDHECVLGKGVHMAPGSILCGCVEIGDYTLIGPGSVVVPRVRIGKNAIIGAGSTVTRDIPDNVYAWGSPARVIRENVQ